MIGLRHMDQVVPIATLGSIVLLAGIALQQVTFFGELTKKYIFLLLVLSGVLILFAGALYLIFEEADLDEQIALFTICNFIAGFGAIVFFLGMTITLFALINLIFWP